MGQGEAKARHLLHESEWQTQRCMLFTEPIQHEEDVQNSHWHSGVYQKDSHEKSVEGCVVQLVKFLLRSACVTSGGVEGVKEDQQHGLWMLRFQSLRRRDLGLGYRLVRTKFFES